MTLTDASRLYCPSHMHAKLLHPYHKAIKAGKVFFSYNFCTGSIRKRTKSRFSRRSWTAMPWLMGPTSLTWAKVQVIGLPRGICLQVTFYSDIHGMRWGARYLDRCKNLYLWNFFLVVSSYNDLYMTIWWFFLSCSCTIIIFCLIKLLL